tara:strand:- start:8588 stop:8761 length:174 start_codon:yes stop_codon:yes gene_type:complete
MKYHLYDDKEKHQGSFSSLEELRRFLTNRKYEINDRTYMADTFDYIKEIKWHFDIEE